MLAAGAVSGKEKAVTLWGDLAAFAAAVCIVVHWQIGKKLRRCGEALSCMRCAQFATASLVADCGNSLQGVRVNTLSEHSQVAAVANQQTDNARRPPTHTCLTLSVDTHL